MIRTVQMKSFNTYGQRFLATGLNFLPPRERRNSPAFCSLIRNNCNASITDSNPQQLPHLPVPALQDTLKTYLKSVRPHLTAEEYENTKNIVKEFEQPNGIGDNLQKLLQTRAKEKENWLADWWLDNAYLSYRDPVVVYSSPGLAFPLQKFETENDRLVYTAKIVSAALEYKSLIDCNKILTEKFGKNELDMAQYKKIFGTCRVPGQKTDSLVFSPSSKHIIVMHNSNIYKVPVYGGTSSNMILSEEEIVKQLNECITEEVQNVPIGILTSDHRNNWGKAYQSLIKDPKNKESVNIIQSALFVVSLDNDVPYGESDKITAFNQLIHGGGSEQNAGNRWYDKTIQFIINQRGINGLTYEHSPAEGQPIAVLTDYVLKYITSASKNENHVPVGCYEPTSLLKFNINSEIKNNVKSAAQNIDLLSGNLDMNCLHFKEYGKDFIKSKKLSPDSFIQMAMQYAFYRLHGVPAAHYETAQTRIFVHGRTETIRSCSNESVEFAKAMTQFGSDGERVEKLKNAIKAHKDYTLMAMQGRGVDRHLLGLKLIALENGISIPKLYTDVGFTKSAHMRLSTSQVASKYEAVMCYGPLVENGYGCCYNPRDNDMIFAISAFKSCPETSAENFSVALKQALHYMFQILNNTNDLVKSKL